MDTPTFPNESPAPSNKSLSELLPIFVCRDGFAERKGTLCLPPFRQIEAGAFPTSRHTAYILKGTQVLRSKKKYTSDTSKAQTGRSTSPPTTAACIAPNPRERLATESTREFTNYYCRKARKKEAHMPPSSPATLSCSYLLSLKITQNINKPLAPFSPPLPPGNLSPPARVCVRRSTRLTGVHLAGSARASSPNYALERSRECTGTK